MTEERQLEARRRNGLSEAEARRLLAAAGDRSPAPAGRSYRNIVLANTLTLFNLILLVFFVVVVAAGRPADGLFPFIVVANSALGIIQEIRAKRALETAALLVAPRARVIRDGNQRDVAVEEVVDGDLISLQPGRPGRGRRDGGRIDLADAGRVTADGRVGGSGARGRRSAAVGFVRGRRRR